MTMTLNSKVGSRIKLARVRAGMTQKQLGDQLGKSGAAIAYLEQGKRRISPDVLEKIADITQRPLSFFYEQKDEAPSDISEQIMGLKHELAEVKRVLESHASCDGSECCSLFHHAADGMIVMDFDGKVVDVNRQYESLLGWTKDEVEGKGFWEFDFFPAEKMDQLKRLFRTSMDGAKVHQLVRMPMQNKAGETIEVEIHSTLLYRNDQPWAMLSSLRPQVDTAVEIDQILPEA